MLSDAGRVRETDSGTVLFGQINIAFFDLELWYSLIRYRYCSTQASSYQVQVQCFITRCDGSDGAMCMWACPFVHISRTESKSRSQPNKRSLIGLSTPPMVARQVTDPLHVHLGRPISLDTKGHGVAVAMLVKQLGSSIPAQSIYLITFSWSPERIL
jgi:hypothetical protein